MSRVPDYHKNVMQEYKGEWKHEAAIWNRQSGEAVCNETPA